MSSGTSYHPAAAASTHKLIEVCAPLKRTGGIFATHLRDETKNIVPSLEEAFEIGRAVGANVVLSHHKVVGKENHGRSVETLRLIDEQSRIQSVCLDCHLYPATSTMLRAKRIRQSSRVIRAWSTSHPELAGKDFIEILPLYDGSIDAAIEDLKPAGANYFVMNENDVQRIFKYEKTMVGSDRLPNDTAPHPRLWGTFPRVLGHYARDLKLFPLETAVRKMTGLTAGQFGLIDGDISPRATTRTSLYLTRNLTAQHLPVQPLESAASAGTFSTVDCSCCWLCSNVRHSYTICDGCSSSRSNEPSIWRPTGIRRCLRSFSRANSMRALGA